MIVLRGLGCHSQHACAQMNTHTLASRHACMHASHARESSMYIVLVRAQIKGGDGLSVLLTKECTESLYKWFGFDSFDYII